MAIKDAHLTALFERRFTLGKLSVHLEKVFDFSHPHLEDG